MPGESAFEAGQRAVLEEMAAGTPLAAVLDRLVALVELQDPALICSILVLDARNGCLRHGAARRLPERYLAAIDGASIGPNAGSCGTAAYRNQPVLVEDIATDPLWDDYRLLALPFGLRACWSTPIRDPDGACLGTFAMYYKKPRLPGDEARDCTAGATRLASIALVRAQQEKRAKELEDAAREGERRLAFVSENIADVLFCLAVEPGRFRFESINRAFTAATGLAPAAVVGKAVDEVIPTPSLALVLGKYAEAIARRETVRWEERSEYPSGVRHGEVAVTPLYDELGRCHHLVGTVHDITERKVAQARIASQAALLDRARDAIVVRGVDHRVCYWNAGAARLYGWAAEEAVGSDISELLYDEERRPAFVAAVARADEDGAWQGEICQLHRDGHAIDVESSWTLLRDENGAPSGILAINSDVTRRKQLEAQLVLAQRMEGLATLAGGVAHDFNNVLASIVASVDLARRAVLPGDPVVSRLDTIERATTRATALVRQIMAFNRRGPRELEPISLWPVIQEVVELLRATLPAMITVESTLSGDEVPVVVDPTHVHQIAMNLATNAWHAMGAHGRLRIALAPADSVPADDGHPEIRGRFARLTVEDDGAGMDGQTLNRAFEPFFTTKPAGEGTGLGLFVVAELTRAQGAHVRVTSTPGKGTRFDLYFPAASHAVAPASASTPTPPRGAGQRVLFVDDEQSLVTLTTQLLATHGYTAVGHTSPSRALIAFQQDPGAYDAVVTDYAMRGATGIDLVEAIRRIRPDLPMVLVAGNPTPEMAARARRLGLGEVMPKPEFVHRLVGALGRLLGS